MSEMVKSRRTKIESQSNSSSSGWSFRKKIIVGIVFICLISGVITGYYVQRSARLVLALQDEMKALDSGQSPPVYVKLPMEKKYDVSSIDKSVFQDLYSKTDVEFLEMVKPFSDTFNVLSTSMTGKEYGIDWVTGVDNLTAMVPADHVIDFSAPMVNFKDMRVYSNLISALSRHSSCNGDNVRAARLCQVNISLIRQFISQSKSINGLTLIDSMIAIAMVNNLKKTIAVTKGFNGFDSSIFPLLRDRWEAVDNLFPLVGCSVMAEREFIPSFFRRFNMRASSNLGTGTVVIDEKWMEDQLDYYYAPIETFEMPYLEGQIAMDKYSRRIGEAYSLTSGPEFYWTGLTSPFKAVFQVLLTIAVPNYAKAYERECISRSDLRGAYLSFAITYYKAKEGEYPGSLDDLKPYIKPEMLIDPYTGKQFLYERTLDKVKLTSHRLDGDITFLDL